MNPFGNEEDSHHWNFHKHCGRVIKGQDDILRCEIHYVCETMINMIDPIFLPQLQIIYCNLYLLDFNFQELSKCFAKSCQEKSGKNFTLSYI